MEESIDVPESGLKHEIKEAEDMLKSTTKEGRDIDNNDDDKKLEELWPNTSRCPS